MATIAHEATGDVTVFTSKKNWDHAVAALDDTLVEACEWVLKGEDESHRSFFARVERATTELDMLWTITPYGDPKVVQAMLSFTPQCASMTFVHASSRYVSPRRSFFDNTFVPLFERFGHHFPGPIQDRVTNRLSPYLAPRLLRQYDSVFALYPSIVPFLEQCVNPDTVVDWFLPEYHHPSSTTNHEGLQITIPGRVSNSFRNYDLLFDILDEIDNTRDRLTVCLLGRPVDDSGERIINRCERYEEHGYDIQYYPSGEWVPEEEFAHQLTHTDLIFAPINIRGETGDRGQDRVRGRTITSGVIGDAVRIGKPLVMPDEFPVTPEFKDLITTYDDGDDATAFIESWLSSEETRQELQLRAERAVQRFSLENQADRFEAVCQHAIEASRWGQRRVSAK